MVESIGMDPAAAVARSELDDVFRPNDESLGASPPSDEPDPETWGTSPEAIAGAEAAMNLLGGPLA